MKTVIISLALVGLLLIVGIVIGSVVILVPMVTKMAKEERERQQREAEGYTDTNPGSSGEAGETPSSSEESHTARAVRLVTEKDYAGAEKALTKAIEETPKNSELYHLRAHCRQYLNEMKAAVDDMNEAIKLEKEIASYYSLRGYLKICLGQYDEAIADLTESIRLKNDDNESFRTRGLAYYCKGDLDAALRDYKQSYSLSKPGVYAAYAHYFMWCVQARQGHAAEGTKALTDFLEQPSSKTMDAWCKAVGEFLVDEKTEAELLKLAEAAEDTKVVRDQQCEAYYYIAIKRWAAGNKAGARDYLQKAIDTNVYLFLEYEMAKADIKRVE
ncbi:hypothetical protein DB346_12485 [Verrucomicrobia bacterium LW23]|nr:hypothetical protein DB346_12485 [Verrucomicrobia bacterium LW23]